MLRQFLEAPSLLLDSCPLSSQGLVLPLQKTMWRSVPRSQVARQEEEHLLGLEHLTRRPRRGFTGPRT